MNNIDVSKLTDKHRLVMRDYMGDGTYETGLMLDLDDTLCITATGAEVRLSNGQRGWIADYIAEVIEPPLEMRPGMVLVRKGREVSDNPCIAVRVPGAEDLEPWLLSSVMVDYLNQEVERGASWDEWETDSAMREAIESGKLAEAVGSNE